MTTVKILKEKKNLSMEYLKIIISRVSNSRMYVSQKVFLNKFEYRLHKNIFFFSLSENLNNL